MQVYAIPCYPVKRMAKYSAARVRRLAVLRMSAAQIAAKMKVPPSYVVRVLTRRTKLGRPVSPKTLENARKLLATHGA